MTKELLKDLSKRYGVSIYSQEYLDKAEQTLKEKYEKEIESKNKLIQNLNSTLTNTIKDYKEQFELLKEKINKMLSRDLNWDNINDLIDKAKNGGLK